MAHHEDMAKITEYINREMDRILKLGTREEQNDEFSKLNPPLPITPVRMTLTTAVFKYTYVNPPLILKRVIWNEKNGLCEDETSMKLQGPHLVKTLRTFRSKWMTSQDQEQKLLWIFFEYLDTRISQRAINGNEDMIRHIIRDVLKGLAQLHSMSIAHLDLKIGNVMGKKTSRGMVYKLIDFGYSQAMPKKGYLHIPKKSYGTYPYKPPEVMFNNDHGLKSDIWALGAIAWFLSLRYTPFYLDEYEKDKASYRKFLSKRSPTHPENHRFFFPSRSSLEIRDFVEKCMQIDPADRPTAEELLRHPFVQGKKAISHRHDEKNEVTYIYDESLSSYS